MSTPPRKKGTIETILHYLFGNVVTIFASLLSFPILTRVMSVSDYGTFSLINSSLTIGYAVSKLGIQNGIIRYLAEYEGGGEERRREFLSTFAIGMLGAGLAVGLLYMVTVPFASVRLFGRDIGASGYLVALLIPAHCFQSFLVNSLWARHDTWRYNLYNAAETYVPLVLALAGLYLRGGALEWYFYGFIAGKALNVLYFGNRYVDRARIRRRDFSKALYRTAFGYGFPLMLFELAGNILAYGDRFLLKHYTSAADVAKYVVGYNLAMYIANIVILPSNNAIQAKYMQMKSRQGLEETERYLSASLTGFACVVIFVAASVSAVFRDVILLFASAKYADSVLVGQIVLASLLLYSGFPIYGAGLYLSNRTRSLLSCIAVAVAINLALNVALIPRYGMVGAALATLGAYLFATGSIFYLSSLCIRIRVSPYSILVFLLAGGASFFAVSLFTIQNHIASILAKGVVSLLLYGAIVLLLDRKIWYTSRNLYLSFRGSANNP